MLFQPFICPSPSRSYTFLQSIPSLWNYQIADSLLTFTPLFLFSPTCRTLFLSLFKSILLPVFQTGSTPPSQVIVHLYYQCLFFSLIINPPLPLPISLQVALFTFPFSLHHLFGHRLDANAVFPLAHYNCVNSYPLSLRSSTSWDFVLMFFFHPMYTNSGSMLHHECIGI